jgi:hypothetical protein
MARSSVVARTRVLVALAGIHGLALAGCASPPPESTRTGDPLADDEYGRASAAPPARSEAPHSAESMAPAPQSSQGSPRGTGMTLRHHRPFMCEDVGRYWRDGQWYRQGCLKCLCVAGRNSQRIDCREVKGCRKN